MAQFKEIITTRKQLRSILSEPGNAVTSKTISKLDKHCGVFIQRSPFMLLSTANDKGEMDISPKGDPAGFVKIIDKQTLAIPDRLGNHRADSMGNILQNPKVGLIFLIPGKSETLRVSGEAIIVNDPALAQSMAVNNKSPELVIVVDVKEAFFHCSKCMIRSKLWQQDSWPDLAGLPRLARTMVDAGKLELTEDEMHRYVVEDEKDRLY